MKKNFLIALLVVVGNYALSQDTTHAQHIHLKKQKQYIPEVAALQSAMLPGLGQIYNRQYWKVPIALVAVAMPIRQHIKNRQWHTEALYAVEFSHMIQKDPSKESLKELLSPEFLIAYENSKSVGGIMQFRTTAMRARKTYRQGMDYSVMWSKMVLFFDIITIIFMLPNER